MERGKGLSKKEELIVPKDEPVPSDEHLPKELRKVIEFIPDPEKKKEAEAILSSEITLIRAYSGPLPSAEEMAIYERTQTGSANRIITLAENQQAHRIEMEKLDFPVRNNHFKMGQWFSLTIGICGLGVTTLLALEGHDWVAGVIGTITTGTILACFIRRKTQDQE
jgi:uncharacterized membrane protein